MKTRKLSLDIDEIMPMLVGIWRRFRKEKGPLDKLQTREFRTVVEGVEAFKKNLDEGDSFVGQEYFAKPDLLGAYLLYHWVIHYQQAMSLMGELPNAPKRVLDLCSGPAPMAFAALRHGATEVYALDRSQAALQLGAEVCGRYGLTIQTRRWDYPRQAIPIEGSFDLIILGHCLEELFPNRDKQWKMKQQQFLQDLLSRLTPTGHLLLVEGSHTESNQRVLQIRDLLVEGGVAIQAPCVWRGACPALQTANSPCYAQRVLEKPYLIKEIQRAAQINLGSLKMSYLIVKSPSAAWPKLAPHHHYRIISPPFESHFGKSYYLCGTDGKKRLASNLREHPVESRAFEYLKRGELISLRQVQQQHQNTLEITEESQIVVEAPCGKPLPSEDELL